MKKILLVEDEDFMVRVLRDNLISVPYAVVVADNGEDAITAARKEKPDLILLDLVLPRKDGFWVLRELKKDANFEKIPILILSNLGDKADIKLAMDLGANGYCVKSHSTISQVMKKVDELILNTTRA